MRAAVLRAAVLLLAAALAAGAQEMRIYSEFQRVDPFGNVVPPDAAAPPREVLSPMVARNAWTSFHVACTVAEDSPSFLYVQQNPELFEVTAYKEVFVKTAQGWIPDRLEPVKLPHLILLPDPERPIAKQTTVVVWLDVRVPARAPVGRMRFQTLLKSGDRWLVSPMEVRVMEPAVVGIRNGRGPLPPVTAPADAALRRVLRTRLCNVPALGRAEQGLTVRALIRRNALQDLAIAGLSQYDLRTPVCGGGAEAAGAEWWLPVRRVLYRHRPPAR